MEKVRLTERPENLSSNSEILDWDIYQYYKFLAERGDVQIQVMYTDELEFLEHANYKGLSSLWVLEGLTMLHPEWEREENPLFVLLFCLYLSVPYSLWENQLQ